MPIQANSENVFDRLFGDSYREGDSHATNSDHQLPSNAPASLEGGLPSTPEAAANGDIAQNSAALLPTKDEDNEKYLFCGYDTTDFVNVMYPNGPNCRHDAARDVFNNLIVLYDGNWDLARNKLLTIQWVKDLIAERGMSEIERLVEGGRKLFQKRESENFNAPQPSKAMRKAIKEVTGRD